MTKPCVVFDVDGTLVDTKEGIINALNYVLKAFGKSSIKKGDENIYIGPPIKDSLINYNNFCEEEASEATDLYRKIYIEKYIINSSLYEGVREVLNNLKNKEYKLAVATMKTSKQVKKLLEILNLNDYFDYIECATEDGTMTKKQMLENIKKSFNSDRIIMIGDTYSDYKASKQAGCLFVLAEYGYGFCDDNNIIKIKKIDEVIEILKTYENGVLDK